MQEERSACGQGPGSSQRAVERPPYDSEDALSCDGLKIVSPPTASGGTFSTWFLVPTTSTASLLQ